jgi:hypothetical protein
MPRIKSERPAFDEKFPEVADERRQVDNAR